MERTRELEKPVVGATGSRLPRFRNRKDQARNYNQTELRASDLASKALRRVCADVRAEPSRLPLGAFRLAQWVRLGNLPYQRTWDGLTFAATSAGADPAWVRRVLYRAFGDSMVHGLEPMPLTVLVGGLR